MPYNAQGQWEDEDASVSNRMAQVLSRDNEYMQQAATDGKKAANRRGLLNSTMGVSAVEDSRIRAALPIASQEAGQAHQYNLQGRESQNQERMQGRQFEHETGMQTRDITSREGMQTRDIASREGMQARDLTSRERMQTEDIAAGDRRLTQTLNAEASRQATDLAVRERIATLDRAAQERIARMNVSAQERTSAANLAASFESSYAQMVANIMANPELPANIRQQYVTHAGRIRDSNLRLVEQFYSIDLAWGSGSSGATPQPGDPPRSFRLNFS